MPCDDCRKMKAQLDAALDFLYTEMGWEYFRQEMLYHDDEKKKSASGENARKLRNFLVDCGYRPLDDIPGAGKQQTRSNALRPEEP